MNCVIDGRKFLIVGKSDIDDSAHDLYDLAYLSLLFICHEEAFLLNQIKPVYSRAAAPPTISEISLVTCA